MEIYEKQCDLFALPVAEWRVFAHCISSDFALGKGIAVQFNEKYHMSSKLHRRFPDVRNNSAVGKALFIDGVFNLVTKKRYFDKPTYKSLQASLEDMREQLYGSSVERIYMPKIGCGLDRLKWDKVKKMIEDTFEDTDITIVVCYL